MPGCLTFPFDTSPNFIIDQPLILVSCNRVKHSISKNSRLHRWILKIYFAEILNMSPHTIVGITMSSHVHHQLSCCCYLEEMHFRAPSFKSIKLQRRFAYKHFFDNHVSMWGYLRYCFSVSMLSRLSYTRICDTPGVL